MSKPYDAATKRLIEMRPLDWVRFFGLPTGPVQLVDADLSTVSLAMDRLIRVDSSVPYLLHHELESGKEGATLARRLLRYNVNAGEKFGLPVLSAVILLRRESDSPGLTGALTLEGPDRTVYLSFEYRVVRVWQLDPERLLESGLTMLPFAPIANVDLEALPALIRRMDDRIEEEANSEKEAGDLWAATYVLMGLRYNRALNAQLLQGVRRMRDSDTYQAILEEGALAEARRMLVRAGAHRLGPASSSVQARISSIASIETLETLMDRIFAVESWDDLLDDGETVIRTTQ